MSAKDPIVEKMKEDLKKSDEISLKEWELKKFRVESQYAQMKNSASQAQLLKEYRYIDHEQEHIKDNVTDSELYLEAAKGGYNFMSPEFKDLVPMFGRNIILMGATTGEGKSTATANIALENMKQGKTTLILTNEEEPSDIYNRITCLIRSWAYSSHNEFTDEQKAEFSKMMPLLSDWVRVIKDTMRVGNTYISGNTTTLEGIKNRISDLLEEPRKTDCIIIDYIQKVSTSIDNPRLAEWEVLKRTVEFLDNFKNRYPAPIVIMSQLKPKDKDGEDAFEVRIKGFKGILVPVTCAIEMRGNKKEFLTEFVIHKNRWFSEKGIGNSVILAWHKGKYVSRDDKGWLQWAANKKAQRALKEASKYGKTVPTNSNGTSDT